MSSLAGRFVPYLNSWEALEHLSKPLPHSCTFPTLNARLETVLRWCIPCKSLIFGFSLQLSSGCTWVPSVVRQFYSVSGSSFRASGCSPVEQCSGLGSREARSLPFNLWVQLLSFRLQPFRPMLRARVLRGESTPIQWVASAQ